MTEPPGPSSYESEMPGSWASFTNRVDANQPTAEERAAAENLIRNGWFSDEVSRYERSKAREDFLNGMRYGFKDRTYSVNWDVWRSEYKDRHYPPGSFDPRPSPGPQGPDDIPVAPDPNKPDWMTDEQWERELKRQLERDQRELDRQMKKYGGRPGQGKIGEPMRPEDHPFYRPPDKVWRPKFGFPWVKRVEKPGKGESQADRWRRRQMRDDYYRRQREERRRNEENE